LIIRAARKTTSFVGWVSNPDNGAHRIVNTKDNKPAGAIIGHPAHAYRDIRRLSRAAFELDRGGFAARNQFSKLCFIRGF
jgi:hypothetical protein